MSTLPQKHQFLAMAPSQKKLKQTRWFQSFVENNYNACVCLEFSNNHDIINMKVILNIEAINKNLLSIWRYLVYIP